MSKKTFKKKKKNVVGRKTIKSKSKKVVKKKAIKKKFVVSSFRGNPAFASFDSTTLTRERNRVYQIRVRLKAKLKLATNKTQKLLVRSEIQKTTRYLDKLKKELTGTYKRKSRKFKEESYSIGEGILVENIYKWEVHKAIDSLLNSNRFEEFVIGGVSYSGDSPFEVLSAVDDLETEADLTGEYFMRVTTNFNALRITVSI